jgi:oligopeptide transport system substrate-binding protein
MNGPTSAAVSRRKNEGRRMRALGRVVVFTFCILHSAFLCGCIRREPPADITIVNGAEPESLDPAIVTGVPEMRITRALFDGLTRLDAHTARPVPALAASWEISPDGRVYIFHLRTNAVWSTGEPITTADVVWSWQRALSPATASDYAGQLFCIKGAEDYYNGRIKDTQTGIRALDPHTLRVELNTPLPFFLDVCAFPTLAVVPRQTIEKYGDRWLHARPLPASGAFQLGDWRLNDRVRLLRNPLYWDAAQTASGIIDVLPIGSPNTALNLYKTGAADIVWDKDIVPAELLDVLVKRPDFHTFDYLGTYFFRFNVTRPPLNDPRVRRAFALATDKARLVKKLLTGGERPAFCFVPDFTANYHPPGGLPFAPEQARKLLAEAGFPGGKGFPAVQYAFPAAAGGAGNMQGKIAVELQQMWRNELGVNIELRQIERKIFYNTQSRLDFDLSGSSWIGDYNDANTFLDLFTSTSGNNRTGWKNTRYDEVIREANLQTDLARRAELFRQAELKLVSEEAPIVPLYFFVGFNCFDTNRIQGIYQNALDEHPLQYIRKVGRESRGESREVGPHISQTRRSAYFPICMADFQTSWRPDSSDTLPIWKSATQQVWKPAPQLQVHRPHS